MVRRSSFDAIGRVLPSGGSGFAGASTSQGRIEVCMSCRHNVVGNGRSRRQFRVIARPVASVALMRSLERACPGAHRRVSVIVLDVIIGGRLLVGEIPDSGAVAVVK
jgi:hypothetical protein